MTQLIYLNYSSCSELFAPSLSNHVVTVNAALSRSLKRLNSPATAKLTNVAALYQSVTKIQQKPGS